LGGKYGIYLFSNGKDFTWSFSKPSNSTRPSDTVTLMLFLSLVHVLSKLQSKLSYYLYYLGPVAFIVHINGLPSALAKRERTFDNEVSEGDDDDVTIFMATQQSLKL
jgi:hypothetical protein